MAATRISPGVYEVNGKRVNATTSAEAEKMAGGVKKPAAKTPAQGGGSGKINLPDKITNIEQGVNAEKTVQGAQAAENIRLNNPNQVNTFGSQTTTVDENGVPTVTSKLSPEQQAIVDKDAAISNKGRELALSLAGEGNLNQQFDPKLQDRIGSGDLINDRRRQEEELSQYLARDMDKNYDTKKQQLEQTLYNRGIALDPNNKQYQDHMREFEDTFARERGDIRAQALQFGGQEMDRTFGMNEQTRANQFNEQQGTRNQRIGEINQWAGAGTGAQIPNFTPYQGTSVNYGSPNQIGLGLTAAQQNARQLKIAQQAANRVGGGGGGGSSQTVATSPFVEG